MKFGAMSISGLVRVVFNKKAVWVREEVNDNRGQYIWIRENGVNCGEVWTDIEMIKTLKKRYAEAEVKGKYDVWFKEGTLNITKV